MPSDRAGSLSFIFLLHAVVAVRTEGLQVVPVPEQRRVPLVRGDVVNVFGGRTAHDTGRVAGEGTRPAGLPTGACSRAGGCSGGGRHGGGLGRGWWRAGKFRSPRRARSPHRRTGATVGEPEPFGLAESTRSQRPDP